MGGRPAYSAMQRQLRCFWEAEFSPWPGHSAGWQQIIHAALVGLGKWKAPWRLSLDCWTAGWWGSRGGAGEGPEGPPPPLLPGG